MKTFLAGMVLGLLALISTAAMAEDQCKQDSDCPAMFQCVQEEYPCYDEQYACPPCESFCDPDSEICEEKECPPCGDVVTGEGCEPVLEMRCKFSPPECTEDAECGEGFECVDKQDCPTSGGGCTCAGCECAPCEAENPDECPPCDCPEVAECQCEEVTEQECEFLGSYCAPKEQTCTEDSDCAEGFVCFEMNGTVDSGCDCACAAVEGEDVTCSCDDVCGGGAPDEDVTVQGTCMPEGWDQYMTDDEAQAGEEKGNEDTVGGDSVVAPTSDNDSNGTTKKKAASTCSAGGVAPLGSLLNPALVLLFAWFVSRRRSRNI